MQAMDSEPVNHGADNEKTLTLRIFGSHEAADLAAAKLEAHGIKCWVAADDCSGMYPSLTTAAGVRLKVQAADAEAADALLDAQATPAEINKIEADALAATPPKTAPFKKPAWGQIAIGFLLGLLVSLLFQGNKNPGNNTYYSYTVDGKCYEASVYRNGHIVEICEDRNLDGRWDAWFYYQHGQVVRAEIDENFDGKRDLFVTYSNSLVVSTERDTDFNGIPDEFCSYKNGVLQQVDFRPNGSKFTTTREIYTNGVLTEIWRGGDSHGFFNEVEKYDSFFNEVGRKNPYSEPIGANTSAPFELATPLSK